MLVLFSFLFFLSLLALIVFVVLLIVRAVKMSSKKLPAIGIIASFALCIISFVGIALTAEPLETPTVTTNNIEATTQPESVMTEQPKIPELPMQTEEEFKNACVSITYDQIARTPDDFVGTPIMITGEVIQVLEGSDNYMEFRLALDEYYDDIVYGFYTRKDKELRILENDIVQVWGISSGLITYTSTMGGDITIPSIDGYYISIIN